MKNSKLASIDATLEQALQKKDVKSLETAEEKAENNKTAEEKAEELDRMRARAGRPKKSAAEKAKPKTLYFSDAEWREIEKFATLNGVKAVDYIKNVINKEIRRERGIS